jgi:O-antigen ligase
MHSLELGRARASSRIIDEYVIGPILACIFTVIVAPLLIFVTSADPPSLRSTASMLESMTTPRTENKIIWPALAAISLVVALRNRSRLTLPPHIICLIAYLALAGASVLWAFKPEVSLTRFVLQVMILTSIVLPALPAIRTADMMRGVFLCFAFASILNVFFVLGQSPIIYVVENHQELIIGYPGYFTFKGTLGECAAITFLLSLYQMLFPGLRRLFAVIVLVVTTYLMFVSQSKGALGLAIIAPVLAQLTLLVGKKMHVSPAVVLLPVLFCYEVLSRIPGSNIINRVSYMLYENYTLSGRTIIWDFVNYEIGRRPLLGWGYQSFWLVGLDAPSVVEAPGWVKAMPSAHNGYLDMMLDTGYVGFALFVIFIVATLHAIRRVADRDPARAWLVLSLAIFIILTNFLESGWMHGGDILWVIFAIVVAEIARSSHASSVSSYARSRHRHGFQAPHSRPSDARGALGSDIA